MHPITITIMSVVLRGPSLVGGSDIVIGNSDVKSGESLIPVFSDISVVDLVNLVNSGTKSIPPVGVTELLTSRGEEH